jgi:hypothetical protein
VGSSRPDPSALPDATQEAAHDPVGHLFRAACAGSVRAYACPPRWAPRAQAAGATLEQKGPRHRAAAPAFRRLLADLAPDKTIRSRRRLTLDDRTDRPTAWTPDSRTVLFGSNRNGTLDIFRQQIDSANAEVIVGGSDEEDVPRVTPDGKSVIYRVLPRSGSTDTAIRFVRVPLEGGKPELILSTNRQASGRCDPGGPCVVVETVPRNRVVYELDPIIASGESKPAHVIRSSETRSERCVRSRTAAGRSDDRGRHGA